MLSDIHDNKAALRGTHNSPRGLISRGEFGYRFIRGMVEPWGDDARRYKPMKSNVFFISLRDVCDSDV